MRIITGSARGTKLQTLEGESTRPTAEKVKEAIFSMIQFDIEGRRVLDPFAGSGQLALEALSRGAKDAVILDNNHDAVKIIKENAKKTHMFDKCVILNSNYKSYLKGASDKEMFDLIFLDPPYDSDMLDDSLDLLIKGNMIAPNGIVICETDKDYIPAHGDMNLHRHVKYGRTFITVFINGEEEI